MSVLAGELQAKVDALWPTLRALSEAEASADRGAGKWVRKEILGHLIDSAANNQQRFIRAPLVDPFVWPGYDQNRWVSIHGYRHRPWLELVDLWAGMNGQVARAMAAVPPDRLATECVIGEHRGTLEWWMQDYIRHLAHHLDQIVGGGD
jgi:hypothetical protein